MITANELRKHQPIQQRYADQLRDLEQHLIEANKKGFSCYNFEIDHRPQIEMSELHKYLESLGYKVQVSQPVPPYRGWDYAYEFEIRW